MSVSRNLKPVAVTAALLSAAALFPGGGAAAAEPLASGAEYVAMGSSFAAGPGVTTSADTPPNRCGRSKDNYAHQFARRRGLALTDVSCGGATTANVLSRWDELPPQIDAVDRGARFVTITIGGNDLNYVGGIFALSCKEGAPSADAAAWCSAVPPPTEQAFADVETNLRRIAAEIHRRAPAALLIFVEYPTILPPHGRCPAAPLSQADANAAREVGRRLAEITARVAEQGDAQLIQTGKLTEGHDACAAAPWMTGFPQRGAPVVGAPFHPNLAGMTAIADALDQLVPP